MTPGLGSLRVGLILISVRKSECSALPPELSRVGKEIARVWRSLGGSSGDSKRDPGVIRFFDFVSLAHGLLIRLLSFILDFTSVLVPVS